MSMKSRLIYMSATTLSVVIGAFFFNSSLGGDDTAPQTSGIMDDSSFTNMIHGQAPTYLTLSESEIVNKAKGVCTALDNGTTAQTLHDQMTAGMSPEAALDEQYFLNASVTQYCIKYSKDIAPYIQK